MFIFFKKMSLFNAFSVVNLFIAFAWIYYSCGYINKSSVLTDAMHIGIFVSLTWI